MKQKLLKTWLMLCLLVVGVGTTWAETKTITLQASDFIGTGSSYLTTAQALTIGGLGYKACNYNPSTKQIRGNNSTLDNNFYVYNTDALPGVVKSIKITATDKNFAAYGSVNSYVGTGSITSNPTNVSATGTIGNSAASTVTIDLSSNTTGKYFRVQLKDGSTTGTCKLSSIEVTYETSGGDSGNGGSSTQYSYSLETVGNGTTTFKDVNGNTVAPNQKVNSGTTIKPTFTPDDGYEFTSWEYYTTAGAWSTPSQSEFTITKDVKFRVTYSETQSGGSSDGGTLVYKKISSASDIVAGGTYLIVCEDQKTALGSQSTNRRNNANVTISNNTISLTSVNTDNNPFEVTFETKTGTTKQFLLKLSNDKYLGNASNNNNLKEYDKYQVNGGTGWTIDFNTTGNVTMKTDYSTTPRILCVNTSNADSYATYTSDDGHKKVTLYKKVEGPVEIPNLIKTASKDLYVGDEIADLKTYLNLPNDYKGTVTFSSEQDGTIVTLADEMVEANAAGKATINVTAAANGNYLETTGTITLNISKKTPVLSFENASYTIFNLADNNENKFAGQDATVTEGAKVKYTITGTGATVDNDGNVSITGVGEATVTASTEETYALNAATSVSYTIKIVDPSITITPEDGIVSSTAPGVTINTNGSKIEYIDYDNNLSGNGTSTATVTYSASGTLVVEVADDANNTFEKQFDIKYLQDANLQFAAESQTVSMNAEPFAALALTKRTDAPVTYSLDIKGDDTGNPIASIDSGTGLITLSGAKATNVSRKIYVVASTPKTDTYAVGEARYELIVKKLEPQISWGDVTDITIDLDEEDQLPTLTNPKGLTITYKSSNTDVADFTDGVLEIKNPGTTTISASISTTAYYDATTVSYDLTYAPTYTVTFSVNGEETDVREESCGAGVEAPVVDPIAGKVFRGWAEAAINGTTDTAPIFVAASTLNSLTENKKLYAVFASASAGAEGSIVFDLSTISNISTGNAERTLTDNDVTFTFSLVGDANVSGTHYVNMAKSSTLTQDVALAGAIKSITFEKFKYSSATNASMLVEGKKNAGDSYATVQSCGGSYTGDAIDFSSHDYNFFKITVGGERTVMFQKMTVNYSSVEYSGYCTTIGFDLAVSAVGYATLCLPYNANVPANAEIYTGQYNAETGKVTLVEPGDNKVFAGAGYIVKAPQGTYTFRATNESVEEPTNNNLVGVTERTKLTADGTIYNFANQSKGVGFYILGKDAYLGANKAYLKIPAGSSAGVREFVGFGDDTETGINAIDALPMADGKFLKDGKIIIVKNGVKYNVNGQRMR